MSVDSFYNKRRVNEPPAESKNTKKQNSSGNEYGGIGYPEEPFAQEDHTFQPPMLSSYLMSLLSELNNKKPAQVPPYEESHHHNKTGTTINSKRTSIGYNTGTPFTTLLSGDIGKGDGEPMDEVNSPKQVHFSHRLQGNGVGNHDFGSHDFGSHEFDNHDFGHNSTNLSNNHVPEYDDTYHQRLASKAGPELWSKTPKSRARFARSSLGAPKRVSKIDISGIDDGESDQMDHPDDHHEDRAKLQWLEQEKNRIHAKNLEMMEKLSRLERPSIYQDKENVRRGTPAPNTMGSGKVLSSITNKMNQEAQYPGSFKETASTNDALSHVKDNRNSNQHSNQNSSPHYQGNKPYLAPVITSNPSNSLTINGKTYEKLELIGKGGSSKVYKLKNVANNKIYAVKRVKLEDFDQSAIDGFKGEIDILQRLQDETRVVRLIDHSMADNCLMLVMECGDIDLLHVLSSRANMPLDVTFVRYHMIEMLKCVQAVHEAGVVHSDLKPANFLFVRGILKIIDFGIANALTDHTMNVYRESQIGTPNYMSPESLLEANPMQQYQQSMWKVGKPSDIWSCGCIVYQMIYGKPPYAIYSGNQRLLLIMNPQVKISYPECGLGGIRVPRTLIELMKNCLQRDPNRRWTIDEVLGSGFCNPQYVTKDFIQDLVNNAISFGAKHGDISLESLDVLTDEVWSKIEELNI